MYLNPNLKVALVILGPVSRRCLFKIILKIVLLKPALEDASSIALLSKPESTIFVSLVRSWLLKDPP